MDENNDIIDTVEVVKEETPDAPKFLTNDLKKRIVTGAAIAAGAVIGIFVISKLAESDEDDESTTIDEPKSVEDEDN